MPSISSTQARGRWAASAAAAVPTSPRPEALTGPRPTRRSPPSRRGSPADAQFPRTGDGRRRDPGSLPAEAIARRPLRHAASGDAARPKGGDRMRAIAHAVGALMLLGSGLLALAASGAAADDLCGRPQEQLGPLFERLSKTEKLPEIHRDKAYIALHDKARDTTWTFTVAGHPAHPSAVCRRAVQDGDRLRIEMGISCGASEAECEKLVDAFEQMNQRMIQDLEKQQK